MDADAADESGLSTDDRQRRSLFSLELRRLSASLPPSLRARCDAAFVEAFARALLAPQLFDIVRELQEVQQLAEQQMWRARLDRVRAHEARRRELAARNRPLYPTAPGVQCVVAAASAAPDSQAGGESARLEQQCADELRRSDARVVQETDNAVSQQQATLQQAGLPGFSVSNRPDDVRFQMHLLEFVGKMHALSPPPPPPLSSTAQLL